MLHSTSLKRTISVSHSWRTDDLIWVHTFFFPSCLFRLFWENSYWLLNNFPLYMKKLQGTRRNMLQVQSCKENHMQRKISVGFFL